MFCSSHFRQRSFRTWIIAMRVFGRCAPSISHASFVLLNGVMPRRARLLVRVSANVQNFRCAHLCAQSFWRRVPCAPSPPWRWTGAPGMKRTYTGEVSVRLCSSLQSSFNRRTSASRPRRGWAGCVRDRVCSSRPLSSSWRAPSPLPVSSKNGDSELRLPLCSTAPSWCRPCGASVLMNRFPSATSSPYAYIQTVAGRLVSQATRRSTGRFVLHELSFPLHLATAAQRLVDSQTEQFISSLEHLFYEVSILCGPTTSAWRLDIFCADVLMSCLRGCFFGT